MKRKIKCITTVCLCVSLVASMCIFSFAEEQHLDVTVLSDRDITALDDGQISRLKSEVLSMNNNEFDEYIVDLVESTSDRDMLIENLEAVGVSMSYKDIKPDIQQRGVSVGNSYMSVYSTKRSSESYYRIFATTQLKSTETRSGSEDVVAVYFDSTLATYYGTSTVGNYVNLRDSSRAGSGTVVFNFDDKLAGTNSCSSIVYVIAKSGTSGKTFKYAAKWVHTYTKTDVSGSFTADISYGGSTGVSGSIGVNVNLSSSETSWQRMEDNATTI